MPASDYTLAVRAKIGNDLLLQPAASCMIHDDAGRLLLIQDSEQGLWTLPGGAVDPFEAPAAAARREAFEETGLEVEILGIAGVFGGPEFQIIYNNGDLTNYVSTVFHAKAVGGRLHALDGEAQDLRYFTVDEVPLDTMRSGSRLIVKTLFIETPERLPYFLPPSGPVEASH